MSDRTQSTPQPSSETWQELAPFRETFLRHLTREGDAQACRQLGSLIFEMVLDYCRHWAQSAELETVDVLRALLGDLRYLEQGLRSNVAGALETCSLDPREVPLALRAKSWAERLAVVADEIEESITA